MRKYKYGIIGSFSFGKQVYGGQSIKTINFTDELERAVGAGSVMRTDTRGWKKHPFRLVQKILRTLKSCEEIVVLPAHRGILVIPVLVFLLKGFKKNKLKYVVVGGWLSKFLEKHRLLSGVLKRFDGIYVETSFMKSELNAQGFSNVIVLPNFKKIHIIEEKELVYYTEKPLRICTFSRVLKEKGIEDAIDVVKTINEKRGEIVFELDIYGKIDVAYEERFSQIQQELPSYITYKGVADGSGSGDIIKNYFALLFPTRYKTEGVPGTIIDAYCAGVPVISARWNSFEDVVEEGKSGIGFELGNINALETVLTEIASNSAIVNDMKCYCLKKAHEFSPETVIGIFCNDGDM